MKNQAQLITYVDRFGGGNLAALQALLTGPLAGLFGGVHLLPFFHPIDGADAGFDPIDHLSVDARLGHWDDVRRLSEHIEVMGDVIVNHVSSQSPQFLDYQARGADSPYAGLFLRMDTVFPNGAREADLLGIYRPRPGLPFTPYTTAAGRELLWTTFTPQQLDIDVQHPQGKAYLSSILQRFADSGIRMVRLDAVGYAIKQAGTSCFMEPATFAFIAAFAAEARALGIEVLVEIHSHHQRQIDIARQVDWVYDFALPPLLLHALFNGTAEALKRWIAIRPSNALTVLDTHDGIGIIDIGADARAGLPGLVPPAELDRLVDQIHEASGGQSRQATGAAASNLDLYQVNCTYYDALGRDDEAYLLARAVQCFLPGIPQVYYVGLLAGHNDMDLLARTRVGRDINRHHYTPAEIQADLQRPVVQRLCALLKLRNTHAAFNGRFHLASSDEHALHLAWEGEGGERLVLKADFRTRRFEITEDGIARAL
ncbi:MAG: sucrose phosphorylase [Burkholderiales bacterium]|nr:sucrose phosphorylase [Burkholderiales bacterium]